MHGTFALLPPSPFIDLARQLTNARFELLDARHRLHLRRNKATIKNFYRALDAVWDAQGRSNS